MSRAKGRVAACGRPEARVRLRQAHGYLDVARLVVDERGDEWPTVAAGVAVIAGIAAADAICCASVGERFRGEDHQQAVQLLARATPDGSKMADVLSKLLAVKDQSHYGLRLVSAQQARVAIRRATQLVDRARATLDR